MPLAKGTRLGPYEIVEAIGAGGMGEVFRARDSRLDRSVAVKVLPAHLALSPQLRERFDREARSISALNHPNICTLYDVGHQNGIDYLVMELLEGETLFDRLRRGPLPLDQLLRFGAQIADALDRAHRLGIIHRDLKPGNIMITKTGAKLLDFGLAKAVSSTGTADAPTEQQSPLTSEGTLLGTYQYMAPEQLEGEEADSRTDIFALGAVLYEMAAGRRAFEGKTRTSIIAAIVSSEPPPLSQRQPMTPPALDHIIRKCLAKERDERWQSAHDIAADLRWVASSDTAGSASVPRTRRGKLRDAALAVVAVAAIIAAVTLGLLWNRERTLRTTLLVSSSINAPGGSEFSLDGGVALSPDGMRLAFVNDAADATARRIHIRQITTGAIRTLDGTEGAESPFWSPDGRHVGFFAGGKLKRAAVSGGAPQTICDAESPRGGSWSQDGTIVFTPIFRDGLFSVPASGGEPKRLTTPDPKRGETNHRWPTFLPDGRHLLFLAQRAEGGSSNDPSTIEVYSLDSGERKSIIAANSSPLYTQDHLLYWREGNLLARRFDSATRLVSGEAFVVASDAAYGGNEQMLVSASESGRLAYLVSDGGYRDSRLLWVDRSGREVDVLAEDSSFFGPVISPAGNLVAVGVRSSHGLWTIDVARKVRSRVTTAPGDEWGAVWSPDGSRIAYSSNEQPLGIWTVPSTGGEGERLWQGENPHARGWSGDDVLIEFNDSKLNWGFGLFSMKDRKFRTLVQTPFMDLAPAFSPDGQWIAFMSDQTGRFEIYVLSLATMQQWQISTEGGGSPRWARDGGEVYFLSTDQRMMSVAIERIPRFEAGDPEALFRASTVGREDPQYDVLGRDRFLINSPAADAKRGSVTLIQNWTMLRKD